MKSLMKKLNVSGVAEAPAASLVNELSDAAIDKVTGAGCWVQGGGSGGVGLYHHSSYPDHQN